MFPTETRESNPDIPPHNSAMAEYHLSAKTCSRDFGTGAGGHARYILRTGPYAEQEVEVTDGATVRRARVSRTAELAHAHSAHLPAWAQADPLAYWDAADRHERANGTVYRELEFALPAELSESENKTLALAFAEALAHVPGGATPYTLVIHRSERDPALLHAHLLLSDKVNDGLERDPALWFKRAANVGRDPALGGAPKTQARIAQDWLGQTVRPLWAEMANTALAHAGHAARIDHRTLEARRQEQEHLADAARQRGDDMAAARHRQAAAALDKPAQPKRGRVLEHGGPDKAPGQAQVWARYEADLVERAVAVQRVQAAEQAVAQIARAIEQARQEAAQEQAQAAARAAEQARRADPAETLADWLSAPPIPLRGSMEGIPRQQVLDNLCSDQAAGAQPAAWLSEAEQTALRQAGWIDLSDDLTPKGLGAVQMHQAQQAERANAQRAQAEQERQRQAAAQEKQRRKEQERQQEEERRDAQTAAGRFDGIRAPRRTAQDWQHWRAQVLTQAYGDAVQAAELARDWRVQRPRDRQPLTLWGAGGQSIVDYGDRIVPSGDDAWGQPLTDQTLRTALQLAQHKGWDQTGLDITGSAEFRERAARMAARMGMAVANADLQHIVADERAQMQHTAQHPPLSTQPVDKSPAVAPQPASPQPRAVLPTKQAASPDPAREEALAFLGTNPTERRQRWDALVRRVATPPQRAQEPKDRQAALAAWQKSRTQRGLSNQDTAPVFERCTRYGWTEDSLRADWQRQIDAINSQIADLEASGKRWIGSNRNAQQIALLTEQRQRTAQRGNAELALARDWETFKPQVLAQEHDQAIAAWQRDTQQQQRLAPYVLPILEQDRQEAQRAKAEKEAERARQQAERETQPRAAASRRPKTPDRGMGMG